MNILPKISLRDSLCKMDSQDISFRDAVQDDAPQLLEIYAPYIEETAITFEYEVPSAGEFSQRIADISQKFPYIVAVRDGAVLAYAYAGPFRQRKAYDCSVELSIYIRKDARKAGLGKKLYAELEQRLKKMGFTTVYACIAATHRSPDPYLTADSIYFHRRIGFSFAGYFKNCAKKFGLWYDMVYMQKHIADIKEPAAEQEIIDAYTKNRIPTGITLLRGSPCGEQAELYQNVVHICLFNGKNQMLVQLRSKSKRWYAGLWDLSAAGAVDAGESSDQAASRELREELGHSQAFARPILTVHYNLGFDDYYIAHTNRPIESFTLEQSEVQEIKWADKDAIKTMIAQGTFIDYEPELIDLLFAKAFERKCPKPPLPSYSE